MAASNDRPRRAATGSLANLGPAPPGRRFLRPRQSCILGAMPRRPTAAALLLLAACTSTPELPPGGGAGLVAFDTAPPTDTQVWQPPGWRVGDRFALLRGGRARLQFTVAAAGAGGYELVDAQGGRLRRGPDLSNLGEWPAEGEQAVHELTPADVRYHWPLWIGKRWRCQYSDRTAGGPSLPIESAYEVEDLDTVITPGGTFRALRILRRYAPDIGHEVRQVFGDTSVEMVEWQAAAPSGGS
jgi:hypothetical protein